MRGQPFSISVNIASPRLALDRLTSINVLAVLMKALITGFERGVQDFLNVRGGNAGWTGLYGHYGLAQGFQYGLTWAGTAVPASARRRR